MPLLNIVNCVPPTPINMSPLRCCSSLSPSFLLLLFRLAAAMLSAISASDPLLGNPFAAFDCGFTPWDCSDFMFAINPTSPNPVTTSSSGSGSGSDELNQTRAEEKPGSYESNRDESVMDERKRRRMISNRESARRSRKRKQRHLENLRNQANVFRVENQELNNRLQLTLHHCNRVRTENDWLRSERNLLCRKLYYMSQILLFQRLQPDPLCMAMQ